MGFRTGAYATIWEVKPKERSTQVRLSVSKKNKETGKYEQDFSGYVLFVGTAHKEAENLQKGDRVKIGDCDVTTKYDAKKNMTYTNYTVFSCEKADGGGRGNASKTEKNAGRGSGYGADVNYSDQYDGPYTDQFPNAGNAPDEDEDLPF